VILAPVKSSSGQSFEYISISDGDDVSVSFLVISSQMALASGKKWFV
jgi:hypothetical protein